MDPTITRRRRPQRDPKGGGGVVATIFITPDENPNRLLKNGLAQRASQRRLVERKDFSIMRARANPTVSSPATCPSKVERKVLCAVYEDCLDEAIRRNWRGFSCRKCRAFQPLEFGPSEWHLDSLACIALMAVAEVEGRFKHKPRGSILRTLQGIRSKGSILGFTY
jgi:hypothetical protein